MMTNTSLFTIKKAIIVCLFTFNVFTIYAQDSLKVLTVNDFLSLVIQNHPVAKQASLLNEMAKQEIRISRGLLDPTIGSTLNQKEFKATEYYTLWDNYLKIPTWYGVEIKTGFEKHTGSYVNPENQLPSQGLSYLGLSVPLGQGLLIDQRRSQIKQAQQLAFIADADKIKAINKILLDASKDYWEWMYCYYKLQSYKEGYQLAAVRYQGVLDRAKAGDLAAIDTVESHMQMQNFSILLTQAEMEVANAQLMVSNYLWNQDGVPLEMLPGLIPQEAQIENSTLSNQTINELIFDAKSNHPDLLKLQAKMNQLSIERRFQSDKFKPKLSLEYNLLQADFPIKGESFSNNYYSNNYKLGFNFSYPLFLRNERGKYQLTKLKIQETEYEIQRRNLEIVNAIQASANEWLAYKNQILFQENLVESSKVMHKAELEKFENGESSVFLVNARENVIITNQVKLYELKAKYAKSKMMLQWAAGNVSNY